MARTAATSAREILIGSPRNHGQARFSPEQARPRGRSDCPGDGKRCLLNLSVARQFPRTVCDPWARKEAVHVTRLRMGEGLVGTIAAEGRILNLAEAAQHPAFAYRPETGEDRFHSFAGVPIVRLENVIGVLAVQNSRASPLRRRRDRGASDRCNGPFGNDLRALVWSMARAEAERAVPDRSASRV